MEEKTAYDIHLHAFNLSHPSLSAFARRSLRELGRSLVKPRQLVRLTPLLVLLLAVALGVLAVVSFVVSRVPLLRRWVRSLMRALFERVKRFSASSRICSWSWRTTSEARSS